MRAGVAFQNTANSFRAGTDGARQALDSARLSACDLVLAFSTSMHDNETLRDGIRSIIGPAARIVAVDAVGALTNHELGYSGNEVGIAAFSLGGTHCDIATEHGLADGEYAVGKTLGGHLATLDSNSATVLLYDSINRDCGRMELNMATPLLEGITATAGNRPNLVGAGLCGDIAGSPTWQVIDDQLHQQAAVTLSFSEDVRMDSTILHGCQPVSNYMTVTQADGSTILELDHRPVFEVLDKLLGGMMRPEELAFFLSLGVNMGDKWAPFDESAYVNRLCLKIDRKRHGLVMFEPDLVAGTEVQLMHRNIRLDHIAPRVEGVFDQLKERHPVFALYIDCAGRAGAYAGMDIEEAAVIQDAVADRVPLLGVYTGVEISQVMGRPRPLDWTGVFCLFSVPS